MDKDTPPNGSRLPNFMAGANFPMFPGGLPNIFTQGPLAFAAAGGRDPAAAAAAAAAAAVGGRDPEGGHHDKDNEHGSPVTKRKKVESGSGGSSSSKDGAAAAALLRCRDDLQEAAEERERREHERLFKGLRDADDLKGETSLLPLPPGMSGKDIAGYVPNQRLEWKRYKQYTRNDIMAAIEEVKKGEFVLFHQIHVVDSAKNNLVPP